MISICSACRPRARPAVMLGDEAAGIGLVVGDRVAHRDQQADGGLGQRRAGRRAETVADDEIRPHAGFADADARRHRMAIDQHGVAEPLMRALNSRFSAS